LNAIQGTVDHLLHELYSLILHDMSDDFDDLLIEARGLGSKTPYTLSHSLATIDAHQVLKKVAL